MPPWRRCSRVLDVLVSLAEGPPGRADLARRRAITLQAGSHTGGPGTRSGPLLAIVAGQAAHNGLCRPPASNPIDAVRVPYRPQVGVHAQSLMPIRTDVARRMARTGRLGGRG